MKIPNIRIWTLSILAGIVLSLIAPVGFLFAQEFIVENPSDLRRHEEVIVEYNGVEYYYCAGLRFSWSSDLVLVESAVFDGNYQAGPADDESSCTFAANQYLEDNEYFRAIEVLTATGNYEQGLFYPSANFTDSEVISSPRAIAFTNPFDPPEEPPPPDPSITPSIPLHIFLVNPTSMEVGDTAIDGGAFGTYIFCEDADGSFVFVSVPSIFSCSSDRLPRIVLNSLGIPGGAGSVPATLQYEDEGERVGQVINIAIPDFGQECEDDDEECTVDQDRLRDPTCEESDVAMAFVLCPTAKFMLNSLISIVDDGLVQNVLEFDSLSEEGQRDAMYAIWSGFRSLANVGFVIMFFIVVYSALTGSVIGAYDIRKLLPKTLIGAILVQFSFLISTELVRIFNALGNSITELMLGPVGISNGSDAVDAVFTNSGIEFSTLEGVFAAFTSAIVLLLIIVGAFMSVVGIMLMVLVFVVRNMALLILTVIAPLAYVFWLLPNTEKLFRRWWQFYIQLLAIFPVAMAFLASGRLVAAIWAAGDPNSWTNQWLALVSLFAPYLLAPALFKFSGAAIGGIASGIQNSGRTFRKRVGQVRQTSYGERAESRLKSGAARGINRRFGVGGTMQNTPIIGRAVQTKYAQRATARAQNQRRRIESQDRQAARVNVEANRAEARPNFVPMLRNARMELIDEEDNVLPAGSEGVRVPADRALSGDRAEIEYLTQVLESQRASNEEKAEAVASLLDNYSSYGEAVLGINNFMMNLEARSETDTNAGDLRDMVIRESGGQLKAVPHLAKPNSARTVDGMDAQEFHGMRAGSVGAFMQSDDAADRVVQRTIAAANAGGYEGQMVVNSNVEIMYNNANEAQRAELERQFEFAPVADESGDPVLDDDGNVAQFRLVRRYRPGAYNDPSLRNQEGSPVIIPDANDPNARVDSSDLPRPGTEIPEDETQILDENSEGIIIPNANDPNARVDSSNLPQPTGRDDDPLADYDRRAEILPNRERRTRTSRGGVILPDANDPNARVDSSDLPGGDNQDNES